MPKRKILPKAFLPKMQVTLAENFADGTRHTIFEMRKTNAQAFGECNGTLFWGHKKFILKAKMPKAVQNRAISLCTKLAYLLSIEAMNNSGIGVPAGQSNRAVRFLKNEFRADGAGKNAAILGALDKWEAEIGRYSKRDVVSVGFNRAHLQTLRLIMLERLKEALGEEYGTAYYEYLQRLLPKLEDMASKIANSTSSMGTIFSHN